MWNKQILSNKISALLHRLKHIPGSTIVPRQGMGPGEEPVAMMSLNGDNVCDDLNKLFPGFLCILIFGS